MKKIIRVFVLHGLMLLALNVDARDNEDQNTQSVEWVIFPLKDGRLRVNIYNSLRKRLIILIKSDEGETVQKSYIEKKQVKTAINYDISELNDGNYKIYIYSNDTVEIKDFHIENIAEKRYRLLTVR